MGSEAIVEALLHEQVELIFGYPGGAIMPTYDALHRYQEKLKHVLVRHEQGAAHAAEGYARVTGKPGVCIATSGPGATNLITGIADAMLDSIPLVCITGQVTSPLLGTDAFQEADILGMTVPITKWNFQITKPEEIPGAIAKAFYIASHGRPGPVLLDITKDAQFGSLDFQYEPYAAKTNWSKLPDLATQPIGQAAELLNSAKRPYMLVGHGVLIADAGKELLQVAEKSGIPIASTLLGLSAFPTKHPLYAGMLGMHGNYGCNVLTNEADVILACGMRFDDRVTGDAKRYAPNAKIIHIEIDPAEINKIIKADVAIQADAKQALAALLPHLQPRQHPEWLAKFKDCDSQEYEQVISNAVHKQAGEIRMPEVVHQLSELTQGNACIVTDVGQHQMIAARYYRFAKADSFLSSGGLGTMGYALPAAIGAQLGRMDRTVVMIAGDGGFQMNIQELGVIAQEQIPVKMIVLNNNYLGMVRQWQELFFEKRYSFTEISSPDFVKVCEAYAIAARSISKREDLNSALTTMLEHPGPYFLEVMVEKEDNVFPMVPSGASVSEMRLA